MAVPSVMQGTSAEVPSPTHLLYYERKQEPCCPFPVDLLALGQVKFLQPDSVLQCTISKTRDFLLLLSHHSCWSMTFNEKWDREQSNSGFLVGDNRILYHSWFPFAGGQKRKCLEFDLQRFCPHHHALQSETHCQSAWSKKWKPGMD